MVQALHPSLYRFRGPAPLPAQCAPIPCGLTLCGAFGEVARHGLHSRVCMIEDGIESADRQPIVWPKAILGPVKWGSPTLSLDRWETQAQRRSGFDQCGWTRQR